MEEEKTQKHWLEDVPAYKELEQQVIDRWGKPVFSNGRPANLPAQKVLELKRIFIKQRKYKQSNEKVQAAVKAMLDKQEDILSGIVDLPPQVLVPFQLKDQRIIQEYFNMPYGTAQGIARAIDEDVNYVRGFLNSKEFLAARELICRAFRDSLPFEAWLAIQRCLRVPNVDNTVLNTAKLILEDAGQIKGKADTEINIFQTAIDDPKALEELKKLGDRLANEGNEITSTALPS